MKGVLIGVGVAVAAVLLFVVVAAFSIVGLRNKLVVMEEDIQTQWAQVEVQYQRRYDLIPNLVASVEGVMEQEQEIFGEIADARTKYGSATGGDQVTAVNELESVVSRLLVIMEDYPELKSDETVLALMVELEGTENRISVERRRYNDLVNDFNKTIKIFPNNLINEWFFQYVEMDLFEAVVEAEFAPEVDLSPGGDVERSDETEEEVDHVDGEVDEASDLVQ